MELRIGFIMMSNLQPLRRMAIGIEMVLGEEINADGGASGLPGRWNRSALGGTHSPKPRTSAQAESDMWIRITKSHWLHPRHLVESAQN
jgi:hypothetical protein